MRRRTVALLAGGFLSLGLGVSSYMFVYAKGWSYLTDEPAACANCHIMQQHYDAWLQSSHQAVATCNECHTPAALVPQYLTKAEHGFWHSYAFTTGDFHEPIAMGARSRTIVEHACRRCHQAMVLAIDAPHRTGEHLNCLRCHPTVGHPR